MKGWDLSFMNESKGEGKCIMDRMGCLMCEVRFILIEGFLKNVLWIVDLDVFNVKDFIGVFIIVYDNFMVNLEILVIIGVLKCWFLILDVVLVNY